jgi:hypothetical protein
MRFPRRAVVGRARYLVTGLVATSVLAAGGSAAAAPLDRGLAPCAQDLTQPFLPWLDPLSYAFAPNGGLESGLAGWSSSGGARVVSGNESYAVHGAGDAYSLSLPQGASATTPPICIGTLTPTTRFFVRNAGASLSTLRVDVLYTTVLGIRGSALVGLVVGSPSWQPTLPLPLFANVIGLPLLTGGSTQISLRFTALGSGGSWQVDDVYVDPYKGT